MANQIESKWKMECEVGFYRGDTSCVWFAGNEGMEKTAGNCCFINYRGLCRNY